jgi:uncharacterized protein YecT (DUF1311 family)
MANTEMHMRTDELMDAVRAASRAYDEADARLKAARDEVTAAMEVVGRAREDLNKAQNELLAAVVGKTVEEAFWS